MACMGGSAYLIGGHNGGIDFPGIVKVIFACPPSCPPVRFFESERYNGLRFGVDCSLGDTPCTARLSPDPPHETMRCAGREPQQHTLAPRLELLAVGRRAPVVLDQAPSPLLRDAQHRLGADVPFWRAGGTPGRVLHPVAVYAGGRHGGHVGKTPRCSIWAHNARHCAASRRGGGRTFCPGGDAYPAALCEVRPLFSFQFLTAEAASP